MQLSLFIFWRYTQEAEAKLQLFLILVPEGVSALHTGHSTPRDRTPCTPRIGGWVGPRASVKEELVPARNQTRIIQPIF